jgi:hypothetical protein
VPVTDITEANIRCVSVDPSSLPPFSTNGYGGEHFYAFAMPCQRGSVLKLFSSLQSYTNGTYSSWK